MRKRPRNHTRARHASGLFDEPPRSSMGRFEPGHSYSPGTQFLPGERRNVETEFKPGQHTHNRLPLGAITIRKEANTGSLRAWVKVGEPNVWKKRAVVVWEAWWGPLPRGVIVHHIDRDTLNDSPDNLAGETRGDHIGEHRSENSKARREGFRAARAKVTPRVVLTIRARVAAGETYEQIARDCGISTVTVGSIARRETWRDVKEPSDREVAGA